MTDGVFRDLGDVVPGGRRREAAREPIAPAVPVAPNGTVIVTPPPPPTPLRAVFGGIDADNAGAQPVDIVLAPVAELLLHKSTQGPVCVGLVGAPGSGKSFALARLFHRIGALERAAVAAAQGPFVSRIHVQTIDAAALDGDPVLAIAARLHGGLQHDFPELAHEFGAAGQDPHMALREANEKLDDARRRLDTERRALDEAGTRRARLTETVLYEAAGSQVDAYARANRPMIERRLTSFGLAGEPIRTYKDLVQNVVGAGGTLGLALRAVWAFKGQTKLILLACLFAGLAIGLDVSVKQQAVWLADLDGGQHAGAAIAAWARAHIDWLGTAQSAAWLLVVVCLVANVARAARFLQPVLKGAKLLERDLDDRRRALDGLFAHQTKRVDLLEAEIEKLGRVVGEAERRADGVAPRGPSAFEQGGARTEDLLATLSRLLRQASFAKPQRIVLALDHLDAVAPERARHILDALHRTSAPGLVTVVAFDPARLSAAGVADEQVDRWIDVPCRIDAPSDADRADDLVRVALGVPRAAAAAPRLDGRRCDLDAPVTDEERDMLGAAAPLAGATPRAVRRLAALYMLVRDGASNRPLLAVMIALAIGGSARERDLLASALQGDADAPFRLAVGSDRLAAKFARIAERIGPVTNGEAIEAARRAAAVSLRPLI